MNCKGQHLRKVGHGRFAAIALPIGIGDEADRGIERRVGGDVGKLLRIERQRQLQALQRIDGDHAKQAEH